LAFGIGAAILAAARLLQRSVFRRVFAKRFLERRRREEFRSEVLKQSGVERLMPRATAADGRG
jgi:hypothetical protein